MVNEKYENYCLPFLNSQKQFSQVKKGKEWSL
jgi:hypothetical protein